LCIALFLVGCDESTGTIGWDLMPSTDVMKSHTVTYNITTSSVRVDSVYARSDYGYIGRYTDPNFGYYEASFLTEMNCLENYQLPDVYSYDAATGKASGILVDDSVRSFEMSVYYLTWFGDSLNACRMSAYQLNDQWLNDRNPKNKEFRYTNIDVEKYYDEEDLLGTIAYTAYDKTVSEESHASLLTYIPHVTFQLKQEDGQRIYDLNKSHPEYFKNAETFIQNVFPGVYLKSDLGDGTILYVDHVELSMSFLAHYTDSLGVKLVKQVTDEYGEAGTDSVGISKDVVFASTKEVIQANRFANSEILDQKAAETGNTYIKSPAGIFTAIDLPYDQIAADLPNDTINSVTMVLTNYDQESIYDFSMNVPAAVLLIKAKDVKEFFEDAQITDNVETYYVEHNATSNNTYTFSNIARLVTRTIKEKEQAKINAGTWTDEMEAQWKADNRLLLIPVVASFHTDYYSNKIMDTLEHDLKPTYAKLIGGPDNPLTIEVTYTTFE